MQLVESSIIGLRSARIRLTSRTCPAQVTIFPMIHIGERQFYDAVYADAFAQDVVLVEGVKSPITRRITRSYRWIVARNKRIGLSVQSAYPYPSNCRAEVILADLSGDEFNAEWNKVPLWIRLLIEGAAPLIGLYRRFFSTRESIAKGLTLDDSQSIDEIMRGSPETAGLHHAILEARDDRLIACLREQLARPGVDSIAVVYGAKHMRAVIRELTKAHGYQVSQSEWLTVYSV